MGLEDSVVALCQRTFNLAPLSVAPIDTGRGASTMLEVSLPGRTVVLRIGLPTERILGSLALRPLFKKLGIPSAELLLAAEATDFVSDTVQIFERLEGTELLYVIGRLDDAQLAAVAADVQAIRLALSTVQSPGGFGPVHGIERGSSPTWADYVLDEARLASLECLVRDLVPSGTLVKLYRRLRAERGALSEVASTVYSNELLARDLVICRGRVRGVLDPSCLMLGDPLDFYGRVQATWVGHPRGMDYVAALYDAAALSPWERRRADLYCGLARVEWLARRGRSQLASGDASGPALETDVQTERSIAVQLIEAL